MRIYTKTGDRGETSLLGGSRVPKDHPRVAAYGEVDELNAAIGVVGAVRSGPGDAILAQIQSDLFAIGAILAAPDPERVSRVLSKAQLDHERIDALERAIDELSSELPPLTAFVLPGGSPRAAALHFARTVCRRAERSVVTLSRTEPVPELITIYLNRLSDLLFMLARATNRTDGGRERTW